MLDQDGSETVDKEEFKVLETVFSSAARERREQEMQQNASDQKSSDDENGDEKAEETAKTNHLELNFDDDEHGLSRSHSVDTSLLGNHIDEYLYHSDFM